MCMMILRAIILMAFVLLPAIGLAQIPAGQIALLGEDPVASDTFHLDLQANPASYAGTYHFGSSEWESDLTLTVKKGSVTGSLTYGSWNKDATRWLSKSVPLRNGKIIGSMLIADGWYGVFVTMAGERGLVIYKAPAVLGVEYGVRSTFEPER